MNAVLLTLLETVLPLLLAAVLGWFLGRFLPASVPVYIGRSIAPVVWVILWVIGVEAGAVLADFQRSQVLFYQALGYAGLSSLLVFIALWPLSLASKKPVQKKGWRAFWRPFKECLLAFSLLALGAFCAQQSFISKPAVILLLQIELWLYVLLFLIGIELSQVRISRAWLSWPVIKIPVIVMLASWLAGGLLSLILSEKLAIALALVSGFGWFSLTGALHAQFLNQHYAALALFTDLLRELIGIMVVFVFGRRAMQASVAVCGATAADSTLPFVRQACDPSAIPVALVTGLILTLAAPVLVVLFLMSL